MGGEGTSSLCLAEDRKNKGVGWGWVDCTFGGTVPLPWRCGLGGVGEPQPTLIGLASLSVGSSSTWTLAGEKGLKERTDGKKGGRWTSQHRRTRDELEFVVLCAELSWSRLGWNARNG